MDPDYLKGALNVFKIEPFNYEYKIKMLSEIIKHMNSELMTHESCHEEEQNILRILKTVISQLELQNGDFTPIKANLQSAINQIQYLIVHPSSDDLKRIISNEIEYMIRNVIDHEQNKGERSYDDYNPGYYVKTYKHRSQNYSYSISNDDNGCEETTGIDIGIDIDIDVKKIYDDMNTLAQSLTDDYNIPITTTKKAPEKTAEKTTNNFFKNILNALFQH